MADEFTRFGWQLMARLLDNIKVAGTKPGRGRPSSVPRTNVSARLPDDLVHQVDLLGGSRSNHIERALRLYLRAMRGDKGNG